MVGYRRCLGIWALSLLWACGGTQCAGGGRYPALREDAGMLPHALRVRVTQNGLDTITRNVGDVVSSGCNSMGASCRVQPRGADSFVQFALGAQGAPLSFDTSVPVLGNVTATLRAGGLYPDGSEAPGAWVGMDVQGLNRNTRLVLQEGQAGERDGIVVSLGCQRANASRCGSEDYIRGTLDFVLAIENGVLGDAACRVQGDGRNERAFELKSFKFVMRPKVVQDDQGVRRLSLRDQDIEVQTLDLDLSIAVSTANNDPACRRPASGGWFGTGFELADCRAVCGLGTAVETVADFVMNQEAVARVLARTLAQMVFRQLGNVPMEGEGVLDVASLLPFAPRRAQPTAFRLAAGLDGPDVSAHAHGELGLNIDMDLGVSAEHGKCVSLVPTPVWTLPNAPGLGGYVDGVDPNTGGLVSVPVDVGLLLGDASLNRVMFELFDSGALCLSLPAEKLAQLSGGSFAPSTDLLGVVVPGLSRVALGNAPVDMALLPTEPPRIRFGTGEGEGENRDSHIQMDWKRVGVELYPLLADTPTRALAFAVSIQAHLSVLVRGGESVQLVIDKLNITDITQVYNEMGLGFEARGLDALLRTFLPMLLNGDPIDLNLGNMLGLPLAPVVRGVSAVGEGNHYLALMVGLEDANVLQSPLRARPPWMLQGEKMYRVYPWGLWSRR
jgi:hypothetical protein